MTNINIFIGRFWDIPIIRTMARQTAECYNRTFHPAVITTESLNVTRSDSILKDQVGEQPSKRHKSDGHHNHKTMANSKPHDVGYLTNQSESAPAQGLASLEFIKPYTKTRPPLTTSRAEIFTFKRGRDAYEESALSIPAPMIWRLNAIFRCESQISAYKKRLSRLDHANCDLMQMVDDMNGKIKAMKDGPALEEELNDLREAYAIKEDLNKELEDLKALVEQEYVNLDLTRTELFAGLKDVLGRYNLLASQPDGVDGSSATNEEEADMNMEDIQSQRSQSSQPIWSPRPQQQQNIPTASQAAQAAEVLAENIALDELNRTEERLEKVRHRLETWADYYDAEYTHYHDGVREGRIKDGVTVFDNAMLMDHQEATRDLIQAEEEYEAAQEQLRKLDMVPNPQRDHYSESVHGIDAGYDIELEKAWAAGVDRERIHRWMENNSDVNHTEWVDEWDVRSVGLSDSISLIAEGLERKTIDRWRAMCEQHPIKLLADESGKDNTGA